MTLPSPSFCDRVLLGSLVRISQVWVITVNLTADIGIVILFLEDRVPPNLHTMLTPHITLTFSQESVSLR